MSEKRVFFVSPEGSDSAEGTPSSPLKTMTGARNAVRRLYNREKRPAQGYEIVFAPGDYPVENCCEFDIRDSGEPGAPTVYRAEKPGTVRFYGGKKLRNFERVTDSTVLARIPEEARGHVFQCDLKAEGITDFCELISRGYHTSQKQEIPALELYFNGRRMGLARWPKSGFLKPARLIEPGVTGGAPSVLEYSSPRHERWVNAEDLWLFGYFRYLWADGTVKIAKVDTEHKQLIAESCYNCGACGSMSEMQEIRYYAFNLLEELSEPGEWYLNRNTGILYFYPPENPDDAVIELGSNPGYVMNLDKVSYVVFENLDFDMGRMNCCKLSRCEDCTFRNVKITRFAGCGIVLQDGFRCKIENSEIGHTGRTGVLIHAGDRETLTPCNHEILNSIIHHAGCVDKTYTPSVAGLGTGIHLAHNLFCFNPSSLLRLDGNDHLVEYNEFHSAVQESDDQGAVDTFGNPTYRGNVYRYNFFHDIGKLNPEPNNVAGDAGIRLDDTISGTLIYGNIFERSAGGIFGGVQINSGRDNHIVNNIFITGRLGISGGYSAGNDFWTRLYSGADVPGNYFTKLYYKRYPELRYAVDKKGWNFIERNVFSDVGFIINGNHQELKNNLLLKNGCVSIPEVMREAVGKIGFEPIPLKEIGLLPGHLIPEECKSVTLKTDWKSAHQNIEGNCRLLPEWTAFGIFDQNAPLPESLTVPPAEHLGKKAKVLQVPEGKLNLWDPFSGGIDKQTFFVYLQVQVPESGMQTFGFDADWLYDCYLDGKLLYSTGDAKYSSSAISRFNHFETIPLEKGRHTLMFRIIGGSISAVLDIACGQTLREQYQQIFWWDAK